MDTIVIQWYVNKWPGILKFSRYFFGVPNTTGMPLFVNDCKGPLGILPSAISCSGQYRSLTYYHLVLSTFLPFLAAWLFLDVISREPSLNSIPIPNLSSEKKKHTKQLQVWTFTYREKKSMNKIYHLHNYIHHLCVSPPG